MRSAIKNAPHHFFPICVFLKKKRLFGAYRHLPTGSVLPVCLFSLTGNGKPNVIEYSEITDEMAEATDENGELLYGESHILCNLFSIEAVERMGAKPLPYHVAYKKAIKHFFLDNKSHSLQLI